MFYNAGTEDVAFLFINESDMAVTFLANVDGYETSPVTINSNAANVAADADVDFIEDNGESEHVGEADNEAAENEGFTTKMVRC